MTIFKKEGVVSGPSHKSKLHIQGCDTVELRVDMLPEGVECLQNGTKVIAEVEAVDKKSAIVLGVWTNEAVGDLDDQDFAEGATLGTGKILSINQKRRKKIKSLSLTTEEEGEVLRITGDKIHTHNGEVLAVGNEVLFLRPADLVKNIPRRVIEVLG